MTLLSPYNVNFTSASISKDSQNVQLIIPTVHTILIFRTLYKPLYRTAYIFVTIFFNVRDILDLCVKKYLSFYTIFDPKIFLYGYRTD